MNINFQNEDGHFNISWNKNKNGGLFIIYKLNSILFQYNNFIQWGIKHNGITITFFFFFLKILVNGHESARQNRFRQPFFISVVSTLVCRILKMVDSFYTHYCTLNTCVILNILRFFYQHRLIKINKIKIHEFLYIANYNMFF